MIQENRREYVAIYAHSWRLNHLMLILKDRPDWQKGRFNLLGGKMDPEDDGSPIKCAIRELMEEAGLEPIASPQVVGRIEGNFSIVHVVKIQVDCDEPIVPRECETEKVSWHRWEEIRDDPRVLPNLHVLVPLCATGSTGWLLEDYENRDANGVGRPHKVTLTV